MSSPFSAQSSLLSLEQLLSIVSCSQQRAFQLLHGFFQAKSCIAYSSMCLVRCFKSRCCMCHARIAAFNSLQPCTGRAAPTRQHDGESGREPIFQCMGTLLPGKCAYRSTAGARVGTQLHDALQQRRVPLLHCCCSAVLISSRLQCRSWCCQLS